MGTAPGAVESGHVLDHAEDRHLQLAEHGDAAHHVAERDFLGRRDDQGTGEPHLLGHRELRVAGPRRQVDHQHVEFAPLAIGEELAQ